MKIYLVGGAVRDQLLDLPVKERDWVVVGATSKEMLAQGYRPVDAAFPVFLHPESGEEYALARTETKTGPGYKGFQVESGPEITLEQDLQRRDLTINALAKDEDGNLIDFCHGREDLDKGLLRHITPAFSEDPVRLLRIARFAAKLGQWGFRVAHGTHKLMKQMAVSPDLSALKPERVWREMMRSMQESQPWRFFEVLHACGALDQIMPEVAQTLESAGDSHVEKRDSTAIQALKRVVKLTDDPVVRLGVLLYTAAESSDSIDRWLASLRAEKAVALLLEDLLRLGGSIPEPDSVEELLKLASALKPAQQPERLKRFLSAAEALWPKPMVQAKRAISIAAEMVAAKPPSSFYAQGLEGKALGDALREWRITELRQRLNKVDEGAS
jgi:tRNA nucleotidyltransferase (CCA-adding enzyme)